MYAPVTIEDRPDCIAWAEGLAHVLRNGRPITSRLTDKPLSADSPVLVSSAAVTKPAINRELCAPRPFLAMPSIAYRLAKVAAGDGVCGVSLYPVAAHDVVAGHALLRGAGGVLLNEQGQSIRYGTPGEMEVVSRQCFGGREPVCRTLLAGDWNRLFGSEADRAIT